MCSASFWYDVTSYSLICREGRNMKRLCSVAILCCIAPLQSAHASLVTVEPSKDNTLFQSVDGGLSNGAGPHLFVGTNEQNNERRAVIAFDLGSIPDHATINAATISLHVSQTRSVTPQPIDVHRLLADWGEGTSNSGEPGGQGAPTTIGDATWLHRFFDKTFWTAPGGGDFAPSVSASTLVGDVGAYNWSGAGVASDVQQWIDHPATNFGWIFLGSDIDVRARRFDSRVASDAAVRPMLTVNYTIAIPLPPMLVPSIATLLSIGIATTARKRWRRA
jgi:hypothetical protein